MGFIHKQASPSHIGIRTVGVEKACSFSTDSTLCISIVTWNMNGQVQPQPQQGQHQQQQAMVPSLVPSFQTPSSPVPFGCLNSQLALYPLRSLGILCGQLGFLKLPLYPTVPVPSPRRRGI